MQHITQTHINIPYEKINAFCERWNVTRFAVFGSLLRDDFRDDSDVDILLHFRDDFRYSLSDLVQMGDELETLLGRDVDIIDQQALEDSENYIRKQQILETAKVVYELNVSPLL